MKKIRKCLRCDAKFMTTPEVRICMCCKFSMTKVGSLVQGPGASAYEMSYKEASSSISVQHSFVKPIDTRSRE